MANKFLGVAISGGDFGQDLDNPNNGWPGTMGTGSSTPEDYWYDATAPEYSYFVNKGFNIFRIPFMWERVQNTAFGGLSNADINGLVSMLDAAKNAGAVAFLDMHNYGRYKGTALAGSDTSLADVWKKIMSVSAIANHPALYGVELMNEPHDMPDGSSGWATICQTVINAIRQVDSKHVIFVPGYQWQSGDNWPSNNPNFPLSDSANKLVYTAHIYFDGDASGGYFFPTSGIDTSVGVTRFTHFHDWLVAHGVQGLVSEGGIPFGPNAPAGGGSAYAAWATTLDNFLNAIWNSTNCLGFVPFGAGLDWGNWNNIVEPLNNGNYVHADAGVPFPTPLQISDQPSMAVYLKYPGTGTAPSGGGATPPTTTIGLATLSGSVYSNPTTVTLTASAISPRTIAHTFYKVDGGGQTTYSGPFTVSGSGNHTVTYWSVDDQGTTEAQHTQSFTITTPPSNPPTTTIGLSPAPSNGAYSDPTTVTLSASPGSGHTIANTFYQLDGGTQTTYSSPFNVTGAGSRTVVYWSVDNSGNIELSHSTSFNIVEPSGSPPPFQPPPIVIPQNFGTLQSVRKHINKINQVVGVRAYLSADQTGLTASTWDKINLNRVDYDLGKNYDTAAFKFTAPVTGLYQIRANIHYTSVTGNKLYNIAIYKNGSLVKESPKHSSMTNDLDATITDELYLKQNDYIELYGFPDVGGSAASSGITKTGMVIRLISKEGIRQ